MSAALNALGDTSTQSAGTHPDLSLGSLAQSSFMTPLRGSRIASSSSHTTAQSSAPVSTPPDRPGLARKLNGSLGPGATPVFRRYGSVGSGSSTNVPPQDEDQLLGGDGGVLNTPDPERKWKDEPVTPMPARAKGGRTNTATGAKVPTLRDQEKQIDNLKKENFDLKLKVHFLEERLAQLAPDQIDAALKQNINLKVEVQNRSREVKKLKKRITELERAVEQGVSERDALRQEVRDLERRLIAGGGGAGSTARGAVAAAEEELRNLAARNDELLADLDEMRELMQEHMEEKEQLREMLEEAEERARPVSSRSVHSSFAASDAGGGGGEPMRRLRRRVEELEGANAEMQSLVRQREALLKEREDEREDLLDEVEELRAAFEDLQRRREAESVERSESRAQMMEERDAREGVEDALNSVRDKLAAATIELSQKEEEVDAKNREIDELVQEHERILAEVENEWRGEVEEAKNQVEELRDILADREAESKELREQISELSNNTEELHEKFEQALAHLEKESEEKDEELGAANQEIQKLAQQMFQLEEDMDRLKEESDQIRLEEADERHRIEAISARLKEKCSDLNAQLDDVTQQFTDATAEVHEYRRRQEELAAHIEELAEELKHERKERERIEQEFDEADRDHDDTIRRERRTLEGKESALQAALEDLARTQSLLTQREADLVAVQNALHDIESEHRKAGESATTTRFSLQLEVDRLKRDVDRLEDELRRARKDLDERDAKAREREGALDRLHTENRELATQLAAQTQARLNVTEKLDTVQASLRTAEAEVGTLRARVTDLEERYGKDQRSLHLQKSQYHDQLTERNTLLLTIYQYMEKILGVDKTAKKGTQGETKPFTNFTVFHDNLISRLKALSQIQLDFDKRVKDVEHKFSEKMAEMRKQLDQRWRQIDKFEQSVKAAAEAKATWRKKLSSKEGEIEALKTTNNDLSAQLAGSRKPGQVDTYELRSHKTRAENAERRMHNALNQLAAAEEKLATMNAKTMQVDSKWDARVKEYEQRLKAAEEKVKRERLGAKETHVQLETQIKMLTRHKELADKRNAQLQEMMDTLNEAKPSR